MSDALPLRVPDYLAHLLDAIRRIELYLADIGDFSSFQGSWLVQDAVVRNLEIIGEAARNVQRADVAFTERHADVPWSAMVGMRNRSTHGYFDINLDVVWQTVRNDLPVHKSVVSVISNSLKTNLNP